MANPHALAARLALNTGDDLGQLSDGLGSATNPTGLYGIYGLALAALAQTFDTPAQALVVLSSFEQQARRELRVTFADSAELGQRTGATMLNIYGVNVNGPSLLSSQLISTATDSALSVVQAQIIAARSAIQFGTFDKAAVLGDGERVGLLNPLPVIRESTRLITATSQVVQDDTIARAVASEPVQYGYQAIAAINERTTECCLEVHGQVIPLDGQFELTGEPRYADFMSKPPFHWYCRTTMALVPMRDAGDAVTDELLAAAEREQQLRKSGNWNTTTKPVSGVSRRG